MNVHMQFAGLSLGLLIASAASAVTITSDPYTIGYAFGTGGSWTTSETSTNNTPATQGDFNLAINMSGLTNSNSGPYFFNRIIQDGDGSAKGSGAPSFGASLAGTYNGTLPDDATNVVVTLELSQVSIYGASFGPSNQTLNINETTTGHTSSTAFTDNIPFQGFGAGTAGAYHQVVWDPSDFSVAGVSSIRTFTLSESGNGDVNLDGFEVLGTIVVSYEVPEPAALALIGPAALLTLRRRRT